ncbi:MAG: AtpZ/AtpI family protein [Sandaracinaceae bacterium]|nr:AtpZ/AtpI family protein [Sandaracinaceae bacterium]
MNDRLRRGDLDRSVRRDLERRRRREPTSFWRSVSLIGAAGWPIAGLTLGGALVGAYLDARFHTGARATLGLLVLGACVGGIAAYRALRSHR